MRKATSTESVALGIAASAALFLSEKSGLRAQEAPRVGVLEEIVVVAQRIEQDLQDVPISVIAFSGEELALRGVQRIEDLNVRIPNVQITGTPNHGATGGAITIRGIPNVLNYVDGVWIPDVYGRIARQVIEVERIEVLRGPQGALFGRDATGGAIHYITREPADEFSARLAATVGDYARQDFTAAVDAPLGDALKSKWTVGSLQRDGFIESVTTGRKFGDIDNTVIRGDLLWEPSSRFSLRFNFESSEFQQNGPARVTANVYELPQPIFPLAQLYTQFGLPFLNSTHTSGFPGGELGEYQSKTAYQHDGSRMDMDRTILDLEWSLTEKLRLRSITGYLESVTDNTLNPCGCELNLQLGRGLSESDQLSQELQLHGQHERIRWIVGMHYFENEGLDRVMVWQFNEFKFDPVLAALWNQSSPFPPPPNLNFGGAGTTEGTSLYGQASINLTDRLSLSLGIRRYEQDSAGGPVAFSAPMNQSVIGSLPVGPPLAHSVIFSNTESFDHTAPRSSLEYVWNDNLMTYLSYAEGFNSGGVNRAGALPEPIPYDSEIVKTIEIGLRSEWWDRRLRLNVTLFDTAWDDIQVPVYLPDPSGTGGFLPVTITTNAGAAEATGTELELIVAPSDRWRFDLALGLLDTRYTEVGGALNIALDTPFGQAPERSYSIGIQNNHHLGNGGRMTARLDYGWIDDHFTVRAVNLQVKQADYGLLNARVSYEWPNGRYRLAMFGTNLTDEYYLNSRVRDASSGYDPATVGRPRELGFSVQVSLD